MTDMKTELRERFIPTPTPEALEKMRDSRELFLAGAEIVVDITKPSREQSLALTALEEAKYWTNQALARHGAPKED